jgi:CheY-like chemotaxis protein
MTIAKRPTILLIEDEKFIQNIMQVELVKQNFNVIIAGNGKEGLEKVELENPDLILLDIVMPVMNGFAFLEALRSNEKFKDIAVVVTSNLGSDKDIEECKGYGVRDFLVKESTPIFELVEKVKKYLKTDGKLTTDANPTPLSPPPA